MSERYLISPCCNSAIDLHGLANDTAVCPGCSKAYPVREDFDFAELSTGSFDHFKWADDGSHIVRFHFYNMTLEELEGVAERIKLLPLRERRPYVLLPIFKAIYDCLKKRLQQHLTFDRVPNITRDQKAHIEADVPIPGNNLVRLLDILVEAYPGQTEKLNCIKDSNNMKMLVWIRNKEEHIAVAMWPINSYVHTDKSKLPADAQGHIAMLRVPLAVQLLNYAIDLLKLIYDLDPTEVSDWQYEALERHRLHLTV
jgi:hypothetical protein